MISPKTGSSVQLEQWRPAARDRWTMHAQPDRDAARGRLVALIGIVASAVLATLNIVVGVITHSTSVVATGVEFAGDVLASTVVLLGLIFALKPADADHPYGHGRIETIAALVVGLILAGGGVGICWNSLQGVGETHAAPSSAAIAVLIIAIVIRGVMSAVKFRVGRRIQSASLVADGWNDAVDILAAFAALTAVGLAVYDSDRFLAADHYGGFAVGIIVILIGVRVLRDASLELMDTMPSDAMIARVRAAAVAVSGVAGVDKSYARKTGLKYHVDLHIEVDPALTVAASHLIAGEVRSRVRAQVGWVADVLVHVEPASREDTAAPTAAERGSELPSRDLERVPRNDGQAGTRR
jgi:cation diffusion facilitator family transporter